MIRPVICLAAEAVVRDAESNNISVFNILEGSTAAGFPVFLQRLAFFVLWERDQEDPGRLPGRLTVEVGGQPLLNQAVDIDFQGNLRNRTIFAIQGMVIPQPGPLVVALTLETGATASYTFQVKAVAAAVQADAAPGPAAVPEQGRP